MFLLPPPSCQGRFVLLRVSLPNLSPRQFSSGNGVRNSHVLSCGSTECMVGLLDGHCCLQREGRASPFSFLNFSTKRRVEVPAVLMGARSAPELCLLPAWSVETAWVGVRSQPLCPLTTVGSRPAWSGEGPVGKGRVRLLLCQEECTPALGWRPALSQAAQ